MGWQRLEMASTKNLLGFLSDSHALQNVSLSIFRQRLLKPPQGLVTVDVTVASTEEPVSGVVLKAGRQELSLPEYFITTLASST